MASQLDGPGQSKMSTLDEAMQYVQRLHGIVERMAIAIRSQKETSGVGQQLRRAATPLVGLLKPQFGFAADQVSALLLVASRGGADQVRLRALREGVAQLRQQLEIAVTKVKEQHTLHEDSDENPAAHAE